jgi:cellulose synthase/poly-beta-1,6-N-acetylglucosamine synthase-like glycosyltransferase
MHLSPLILIVVPYLILISLFIAGWFKKQKPKNPLTSDNPFISILIPVRNEGHHLPSLLDDMCAQDYPVHQREVIFIDDHSEDDSRDIIGRFSQRNEWIRLIGLTGQSGKKAALWEGIQAAKGTFLLTTDGDCRFPRGWLRAMAEYFRGYPGHLVIGPVFMKEKKGLLNSFQSLEFLSLIASGAGAAGIGMPILCNGANLGASRELFLNAHPVYQSPVASGDDIFFLLWVKKLKVPAVFAKNRMAAVETENSATIGHFIHQRSRWTFKSRYYRNPAIILTAVTVLVTNGILLAALLYSFFRPQFFDDFLLFYIMKCLADYILLFNVTGFFGRRHLLRYFLIHQLLYLVYVTFVGVFGHFAGEKWKR